MTEGRGSGAGPSGGDDRAKWELEMLGLAPKGAPQDPDQADPAALLRSLGSPRRDGRGGRLGKAAAIGVLLFALVLTIDALWRALRFGEWIRLPGIPLVCVVAALAAARLWEWEATGQPRNGTSGE